MLFQRNCLQPTIKKLLIIIHIPQTYSPSNHQSPPSKKHHNIYKPQPLPVQQLYEMQYVHAFPTCKGPSINSNDILIFGGRELLDEDRLWEDRVCRYLFLLGPLFINL